MKKNFMSKKQNENVKLKSGTSRIYEEDDKKVLRPISIEPLMKKSVSKSEDSLDSGIYSRQKSCDSMDSLDSNDVSFIGGSPPMSRYQGRCMTSSTEDASSQQFDDYFREVQDVQDNINDVSDDKSASSVGAETPDELEEDPEANWLRKAGLSELLDSTSASTPGSASNLCDDSDEEESLSSMKVLSTLTKPQREAVLRRVTSFNRVQKERNVRQIAPIQSIFCTDDEDEFDASKKEKSASLPRTSIASFDLIDETPCVDDVITLRRNSDLPKPTPTTSTMTSFSSETRSFSMTSSKHKKSFRFKPKNRDGVVAGVATEVASQSDGEVESCRRPSVASDDEATGSSGSGGGVDDVFVHLPTQTTSSICRLANLLQTYPTPRPPTPPSGHCDKDSNFTSSPTDVTTSPPAAPTCKDSKKRHYNVTSSSANSIASTTLLKLATSLVLHPPIIDKSEDTGSSDQKSLLTIPSEPLTRGPSPKSVLRRSLRRAKSSLSRNTSNARTHHQHVTSITSFKSSKSRSSRKWSELPSWNTYVTGVETLKMISKDDSSVVNELSSSFKDKSFSYSAKMNKELLPNYSLVKDMLGVTKISDLHSSDLRKVQSLAHIELTALLDRYGIEIKHRKSMKVKTKDISVFGLPLTTLVERDQIRLNNNKLTVPLVFTEIINYLESKSLDCEGILRKSGSSARSKLLKQDMNNRFGSHTVDKNLPVSSSPTWEDAHPHDVASLLKQFLRELPDPLLSNSYIDVFNSCDMIRDRKEQLQALNLVIILLANTHRESLEVLLKFLEKVVDAEAVNKMSLNNVAMIMAPNLFLPPKHSKKIEANSAERDIKKAAGTSNIVRMLIKYNELLWTVPAFMISQVRNINSGHNNKQNNKHKVKLFKGVKDHSMKKSTISVVRVEMESQRKVVKILAENMPLTSITVKLNHQLIVEDIFHKFQRQIERMKEDSETISVKTHALFESGGNIYERRLDPAANVYALVCTNPAANLILRKRR